MYKHEHYGFSVVFFNILNLNDFYVVTFLKKPALNRKQIRRVHMKEEFIHFFEKALNRELSELELKVIINMVNQQEALNSPVSNST